MSKHSGIWFPTGVSPATQRAGWVQFTPGQTPQAGEYRTLLSFRVEDLVEQIQRLPRAQREEAQLQLEPHQAQLGLPELSLEQSPATIAEQLLMTLAVSRLHNLDSEKPKAMKPRPQDRELMQQDNLMDWLADLEAVMRLE